MATSDNKRPYFVYKVNEKTSDLKYLGQYTASTKAAAIERATYGQRSKKGFFAAVPAKTISAATVKIK